MIEAAAMERPQDPSTPVPRSQTAARYFQYLWSNKARVTTDGGYASGWGRGPKHGTLGPFVLSFVRTFAHPFVAHEWKHNLAAEDSKKKCADTGWTGPPGLVSHSPLTRRQIFPLPSAGASRAHLAWMCGIAAEIHHTGPCRFVLSPTGLSRDPDVSNGTLHPHDTNRDANLHANQLISWSPSCLTSRLPAATASPAVSQYGTSGAFARSLLKHKITTAWRPNAQGQGMEQYVETSLSGARLRTEA
ncbi:hypothetical protein MRS44_001652 [Fusarium solani]|uniref:uncharacterized protein n=1 Tax=Fusarium solani TaxID=169388 RepID=UPI0032C474A1|nr:hypothetical protein MRS44_001652 [Fusarium solani]